MALSPTVPVMSADQSHAPVSVGLTVSTSPSVPRGSIVQLTGTSSIVVPADIDYSTDGNSWFPVLAYSTDVNGLWTGRGPLVSFLGQTTVTVRDHDMPTTIASITFTVI